MRGLMTRAMAAVLPALLVGGLIIGCSGDKGGGGGGDTGKPPETKHDKKAKGKVEMTALETTGKGTLKGKVKFAGTKPNFASADEMLLAQMKQKDEAHCVAGASKEDQEQQHWRISADGGLANVFVWIQPPEGKFFKIEDASIPADAKKDVVLDQPKCAFHPHAFVLFPSYRDPANPSKMKETGQKLIIKNSNTTAHNTDLEGGDDNPATNNQIQPGGALPPKVLNPSAKEVFFKCTIHPWMNAYARVFDHPYATVTGPDGTYEIKDVPAGAEVNIVVWHEEGGFGKDGKKGKPVTFKAGETTTEDFEIGMK